MRSERLPGKVMLDIAGQPMLERVVRRLARAGALDTIVVATSTQPLDDVIADTAASLGVGVTRGSEEDVLGRFHQAAREFDAGVCVRVSADSPLIDPDVCDLAVEAFHGADPTVDYASNKLDPSFPLGLDVEVFSREALERAASEAKQEFERSHVTVYMYQHPELFSLLPVTTARNLHSWRWTVDTPEDLALAREVFSRLGGRNDFSWLDVVRLIEAEPGLAAINSGVVPRMLEEG